MGTRHRIAIGFGVAGTFSAGLGTAVLPASAQQRTLVVTLPGGSTIAVDVPAGTPLDHVTVPGIVSRGPEPAPTPAPPPAVAPTPSQPKAQRRKPARRAHRKSKRRPAAHRRVRVPAVVAAAPRRRRVAAPAQPVAAPVAPSPRNPTYSVAVPEFFIEKFRIPPFLLPIYQAAGIQYGVRWEILAAINEIETDYGRNLNVSSAGALGWMQFMPATWKQYGTDANRDGRRDPYNPVDAIFAAARYLKAAGAEKDIRRAVFAYNHADWYVDSVLMRAKVIGGMPAELVGSLTGLTQGRFPVAAVSRYVEGRKATNVFARRGAAVVAVQDARIVKRTRHLVRVRDMFGNTYTYANLAKTTTTTRKRVAGGTVLGRIGGTRAHLHFTIRPAGKRAPLIDPKPILDGWKLTEASRLPRRRASTGQVLLMSKAALQRRVLDDPRIDIYRGGREDVRTGQIDRRVLATLAFLSASGLKPTVSSLKGNHGLYTASGNISEHASGNAVDIARINGIPVIGHQGAGSITDITIRRLLTLQGMVKPHQIISLMSYAGADNTLSLPDHTDHIHVGFSPDAVTVLKPLQWTKLIARLGRIDSPTVISR